MVDVNKKKKKNSHDKEERKEDAEHGEDDHHQGQQQLHLRQEGAAQACVHHQRTQPNSVLWSFHHSRFMIVSRMDYILARSCHDRILAGLQTNHLPQFADD